MHCNTLISMAPAKNKPRRSRAWALAVLALFSASALASLPYQKWADEFGIDMNVSYDGKRVIEMKQGTFEAIEHRAPGKMYTEIQMQGMTSGVILREDLGKSWILMPSMGYYKEDTLEGGIMQQNNGLEFTEIEKVGRETIIGHPSTKFKTKFKNNEGKGAGFMWITDTGVPIRFELIYSSSDVKGMRVNMYFTELNLRDQDPAVFELPAGLKPMGISSIGDMIKQGAPAVSESTGQQSPYDTDDEDLAARQQACLEEAAKQAAEQREAQEKRRSIGRLVGAMSRTAARLGVGSDAYKVSREVYNANATANDVAIMAEELGITEDDVERCRNP